MSRLKAFGQALTRSVEIARDETSKMVRMEMSPSSKTGGPLLFYTLKSQADLGNFATGSDSDLGALSQCRLGLDEESRGRFYGTLSSQVPRGAKIERSGYAAFRNRNRPSLFGNQCWDTTVYPYLALRVRNGLARKPLNAADEDAGKVDNNSRLRAALHAHSPTGPAASRAIHALGLGKKELPGPKYFVNIQTDGPVTSDLFQHRLYLDENKGPEWQTVLIPFDDFVLTNMGQVSTSQVAMMRQKIRTVGISAVLDAPNPPSASSPPSKHSPPSALSRGSSSADQEQDDAALEQNERDALQRGSKRHATHNFDIGVEAVYAVGQVEEADQLFQPSS